MEEFVYHRMAEVEEKHFWYVARREILKTLLQRFIDGDYADKKVLDLGAGTGRNVVFFSELFPQIVGAEFSPVARKIAQQKYNLNLIDCIIPDKLPEQKFDLILMLDVLEHIKDDEKAVKKVLERLEEGGCLLITVPAYQFLWSFHDVKNHHYRRYNKKLLAEVVLCAGGKIEFISYFNSLLFPVAAGVRMLKKLLHWRDEIDETKLPPIGLNNCLAKVFKAEKYFLKKRALPFGLSLVAVIRK